MALLEFQYSLRTLGGLHIATAKILKCEVFATADKRLAEAAVAAGFKLLLDA